MLFLKFSSSNLKLIVDRDILVFNLSSMYTYFYNVGHAQTLKLWGRSHIGHLEAII